PTNTRTPTQTFTFTPSFSPTQTPTITPTFIPKACTFNSAAGQSGAHISSRLVDLTVPLNGFQNWNFGRAEPPGCTNNCTTRDMLIFPPQPGATPGTCTTGDSHLGCATVNFSGIDVAVCPRLDPSKTCQG